MVRKRRPRPVKDLDVVAHKVLGQRQLDLFPGIGNQLAGSPRPTDRQIAGRAGQPPRLLDMDRGEGHKAAP